MSNRYDIHLSLLLPKRCNKHIGTYCFCFEGYWFIDTMSITFYSVGFLLFFIMKNRNFGYKKVADKHQNITSIIDTLRKITSSLTLPVIFVSVSYFLRQILQIWINLIMLTYIWNFFVCRRKTSHCNQLNPTKLMLLLKTLSKLSA